MSATQKLRLDEINILAGTQSRAATNSDTVKEYKEALEQGADFPPVIVFSDGSERGKWLADGFHRYHAHHAAGLIEIECDVRAGTLREAVLFSSGANGTHGLPRTNADKHSAVKMVLALKECEDWSDRQIARHCKVSHNFVGDVRRAICHPMTDAPPSVRVVQRGDATYELNTAKIGKTSGPVPMQAVPAPPPAASPTTVPSAAPAPSVAVTTTAERPTLVQQVEQQQAAAGIEQDDEEVALGANSVDDLVAAEEDDFDRLIEENRRIEQANASLRAEIERLRQHVALLTQDDLAAQVDGLVKRAEDAELKFDQLSGRNRDLQGKVRDTQLTNNSLIEQMAKIRVALRVESNADILPAITARRAA